MIWSQLENTTYLNIFRIKLVISRRQLAFSGVKYTRRGYQSIRNKIRCTQTNCSTREYKRRKCKNKWQRFRMSGNNICDHNIWPWFLYEKKEHLLIPFKRFLSRSSYPYFRWNITYYRNMWDNLLVGMCCF